LSICCRAVAFLHGLNGWQHFLGLSCSAVSCRSYGKHSPPVRHSTGPGRGGSELNSVRTTAGAPPPTSWNAGTFVIGQEKQQQCMSGTIFTECVRTARKRTIGALVFLRLFENPEENLDNSLLWATLPHETTEKGRISQENGESRFCTNLAVGEPMARRRYALSSCLMLF